MTRLMRRLLERFVDSSVHTQYVDVQPLAELPIDDQHAQALVEDRQRMAFSSLKTRRMSLLQGYKTPEPYNANRIQAHAHDEGVVMPTERKQSQAVRSITEVQAIPSSIRKTRKA